nr:MAG TPA: hypothetical protein [Caudoviricetes sp.]
MFKTLIKPHFLGFETNYFVCHCSHLFGLFLTDF